MSFFKNVFVGSAMVGNILSRDTAEAGQALVGILTDKFKTEILAVCFYKEHQRQPNADEDYTVDTAALAGYDRIKMYARAITQGVFDQAEQQLIREETHKRRAELHALQAKLRTSNAPHPEGTVAELAERFGVSKSEIRRRKVDGTLNELKEKS